jgi:hypothetical protein
LIAYSLLTLLLFELDVPNNLSANIYGEPIYQLTVTLTSTCIELETDSHGGGTCFSNISPPTWSIHKIHKDIFEASSNPYLNLPFEAPEINIRAVFCLLVIALIVSFITLVLLTLSRGWDGRLLTYNGRIQQRARPRFHIGSLGEMQSHAVIGAFGLLFIVAGAIMLRVQVTRTVSAIRTAANDEEFKHLFYYADVPVQENSGTFWGILWAAVALMAVNSVALVVEPWMLPG